MLRVLLTLTRAVSWITRTRICKSSSFGGVCKRRVGVKSFGHSVTEKFWWLISLDI